MFGGRLDREKFRFVTYGYFAPQFWGGSSTSIEVGHNPTYIAVAGGAAFEFFFSPGQSFLWSTEAARTSRSVPLSSAQAPC